MALAAAVKVSAIFWLPIVFASPPLALLARAAFSGAWKGGALVVFTPGFTHIGLACPGCFSGRPLWESPGAGQAKQPKLHTVHRSGQTRLSGSVRYMQTTTPCTTLLRIEYIQILVIRTSRWGATNTRNDCYTVNCRNPVPCVTHAICAYMCLHLWS